MRATRLVSAAAVVLMGTVPEYAFVTQREQSPLSFDVASIRPVTDQTGVRPIRITANGRLRGRTSLRALIHLAYGAQPYEKIVTVDPADGDYLEKWFDVEAIPPSGSSSPSRLDILAMTRQMLSERFALKARIDTELVRATTLRVIKPGILGPGLRPSPDGCIQSTDEAGFGDARRCNLSVVGDSIRGTVTLDAFVELLSFFAERPILNLTNLDGMFTVDFTAAPDSWRPRVTGQSDAPAFVDAMREQMGLRARTEEGQPIRRFVIERVGPLVEN